MNNNRQRNIIHSTPSVMFVILDDDMPCIQQDYITVSSVTGKYKIFITTYLWLSEWEISYSQYLSIIVTGDTMQSKKKHIIDTGKWRYYTVNLNDTPSQLQYSQYGGNWFIIPISIGSLNTKKNEELIALNRIDVVILC